MERTATLHNNELLDLSMQEEQEEEDENYQVVEDEGSNTNFDDFEPRKGTQQTIPVQSISNEESNISTQQKTSVHLDRGSSRVFSSFKSKNSSIDYVLDSK